MLYIERDRRSRRGAFMVTFIAAVAAIGILTPDFPARSTAILAAVFGLLGAAALGAYQDYLNHLADELAERRSQRMAALAIDD